MPPATTNKPTDYLHLAVIYIVWGSGYLAIKIGVDGPGAFSAFQLQAIRLFIGGGVLALIAWWARAFGGIGRRELLLCVVSAFLFWVGGNGFAIIALRELPSSFVAMAMGTIPLWSAAYHAVRERRLPRHPVAVAIGFVGLGLIFWPTLSPETEEMHASLLAVAALILAPVTWTLATAIQPGLQRKADATAISAIQLLMGAVMATIIMLIDGAPFPAPPSHEAILALLYMAFIGSALSFSSYIKATKLFPAAAVAAFAYVNPLVGLLLGWLILDEIPEVISLIGTAVVTVSVILTIHGTHVSATAARAEAGRTTQ